LGEEDSSLAICPRSLIARALIARVVTTIPITAIDISKNFFYSIAGSVTLDLEQISTVLNTDFWNARTQRSLSKSPAPTNTFSSFQDLLQLNRNIHVRPLPLFL